MRFGTATNMVKKKLGIKEDRRLYVETIAGLKKKAEKSGMPYSILKKVSIEVWLLGRVDIDLAQVNNNGHSLE